jgi:acetyltransferase-like isoleucine patch superfamily enzyme
MNGVRVGDGVLVGMATNVIREVPSGAKVVGNPARQL